jgi:hypothetical protein
MVTIGSNRLRGRRRSGPRSSGCSASTRRCTATCVTRLPRRGRPVGGELDGRWDGIVDDELAAGGSLRGDQAQAAGVGLGDEVAAIGEPGHADRPVQPEGEHPARVGRAGDPQDPRWRPRRSHTSRHGRPRPRRRGCWPPPVRRIGSPLVCLQVGHRPVRAAQRAEPGPARGWCRRSPRTMPSAAMSARSALPGRRAAGCAARARQPVQ